LGGLLRLVEISSHQGWDQCRMAIARVEPIVEHGLRRGRELAAATRTMRGVWTGACEAAHVVADLRRLIQINVFTLRRAQCRSPAFSPTCRRGVRAFPRWPSRGGGWAWTLPPASSRMGSLPRCQQPCQDASRAVTNRRIGSMVVGTVDANIPISTRSVKLYCRSVA
jgi:hypothetical protein